MAAVLAVSSGGCDDLEPPVQNTKNGGIPIDVSNENQTIVQGDVKELFGKKVTNWVVLDPQTKKVRALKWTLPVTAVENVPPNIQSDVRYWMKLPKEFTDQTLFTGMSYDILPHGHAPANIYSVPHWENHFITFTQEQSVAIDCRNTIFPSDNLLPPGPGWFFIPPPDNCIPGMGFHAVSALLPEFNKASFTSSFLPDYYDGKLASLETKAASSYLIERESFSLPAPQVPMPKPTIIPSKIVVTYDRPSDTHIWAMTDFVDAVVIPPQ
ncbi:hypothetical protein LZC95_31250 [Pendulispora brunnea]|uniref:DUF5602 domain-containing protein n=1 Tax=Pendulispora brunnea TaxID=2905690 RepID=A0ABZ2K1G9_9BACT